MEKFNLKEGNEALNRVLLMMKYDANKTLTENVEKIEEHILINQNDVVHVYYARMFCDVPNSSIFFYDNVLTKITE